MYCSVIPCDRDFRVCTGGDECQDCPNYEKCQEHDDWADDGDSRSMELQENQDFAQDGDFSNYEDFLYPADNYDGDY